MDPNPHLYHILTYTKFGPGGLRAPYVLAFAMRSLAIVITIVQSFFSLSSFSPFFAFDALRGNSCVRNNFSPNILAKLEDICKKEIFFGGKFLFFTKKMIFQPFFCFLQPAFGHGRLGHPQSLEYFNYIYFFNFEIVY